MMEACKLRQVDTDYRAHQQAFLNFAVTAEKKAGKNKTKPRYPKFPLFYDYEKELRRAKGKTTINSRFVGLSKYLKETNDG